MKRPHLLLLLVAVMAVASCARVAPTPTPVPPTATPISPTAVPTQESPALEVAGKPFTLSQLRALPTAHVEADGKAYDGVLLLDVLSAAGVSGPGTLTLSASDGYSAKIAVAALDNNSVLAIGADDSLQTIIPGQDKATWVKMLTQIAFAAGEAEAKPAIEVNGKSLTLAEVKALPQVKVDVEGTSYTGVRILDLLKAAGASSAANIALVASDGYAAEVAVADLNEQSILAFAADDALDAVLPGQSKGTWVRGTIQIDCTIPLPEGTILTVNGKPFTMTDFKALPQVEVEVEGTKYLGIRFLDLLKAAGVADGDIAQMLASDGYQGKAVIKQMTDQSILAYNDIGGVNAVLPETDKGGWVKYIIQIEVTKASTEPMPTPKPVDTANSRVVVDSLGNQVTIPKTVTTVASMRSGITEIICALGQKDKIVAVEEMVSGGFSYGEFITKVYPELKGLPAPFAGGDISTEEMLRIGPDLVLHGGLGRIKQADALKKQAPTLPVVIAHFETLEQYMDDIRIVAQCVNAEGRAETLISYLQQKIEYVRSKVQDIPEDQKVRVLYGGHEIYRIYTPDTFEHAQIDVAGGINVARDLSGWHPEVSAEQIIIWDPQVVILLNGADVNAVLNDSKLAGVSAVKNRQVYALPEASWAYSSPRALFCMEWLATKLYPERFADVDIEAAADEFYQAVFGADYTGPSLTQ